MWNGLGPGHAGLDVADHAFGSTRTCPAVGELQTWGHIWGDAVMLILVLVLVLAGPVLDKSCSLI